jgi:hypothetical protein
MAADHATAASIGLGELPPHATLERGDVEVRRRADDPLGARDRLLDHQRAALVAPVRERRERPRDVVVAGGERRR